MQPLRAAEVFERFDAGRKGHLTRREFKLAALMLLGRKPSRVCLKLRLTYVFCRSF